MAYNATLAERVSDAFLKRGIAVETKKMMGGLCYLVDTKMCVGILDHRLMVRFDPAKSAEVFSHAACKPMDFTRRVLRGFAFVEPNGTKTEKQLAGWIDLALEFNPRARRTKRQM